MKIEPISIRKQRWDDLAVDGESNQMFTLDLNQSVSTEVLHVEFDTNTAVALNEVRNGEYL